MSHDEIFEEIRKKLRQAKARTPKPWVAAFDADGTLWDVDLGELFFDYEIHHCPLKLPADPWGYYNTTKATDTPKAYLWLAQINAGQKLVDVRRWAEKAYLSLNPFPTFSFQEKLIRFLLEEEFTVYVVTASIKWAVEPGARRLGIPESNVLGITTAVRDGVVTEQQEGPITWREGKPKALLHKTGGAKPLIAFGNTIGDLALLESAQLIQVAVRSCHSHEHLYESENELQKVAEARGWITLDFSEEW